MPSNDRSPALTARLGGQAADQTHTHENISWLQLQPRDTALRDAARRGDGARRRGAERAAWFDRVDEQPLGFLR